MPETNWGLNPRNPNARVWTDPETGDTTEWTPDASNPDVYIWEDASDGTVYEIPRSEIPDLTPAPRPSPVSAPTRRGPVAGTPVVSAPQAQPEQEPEMPSLTLEELTEQSRDAVRTGLLEGWSFDQLVRTGAVPDDAVNRASYQAYQEAVAAGTMTPNQVPFATGEDPLGGGIGNAFADMVSTFGDRYIRAYREARQYGAPGTLSNEMMDLTDAGVDGLRQRFPGRSEAWYEQTADWMVSRAQRDIRERYAALAAEDPVWRDDEDFVENLTSVERWAPYLLGNLTGGVGPEDALLPGRSALARILAQGVINATANLGYQGIEIADDVRDEVSGSEVALAGALGGAMRVPFEAPGIIRAFRSRGRALRPEEDFAATLRMSDEDVGEFNRLTEEGTADDIINFVSSRPDIEIDEAAVRAWVRQRDGEAPAPRSTEENLEGDALSRPTESDGTFLSDMLAEGNAPLRSRTMDEEVDLEGRVLDDGIELDTPLPRPSPAALEKAAEQVASRINRLTRGWRNAPDITVHQSFDDLDGVNPRAVGYIDELNQININMSRLQSAAAAKGISPDDMLSAVVFHESLGHYGLSQRFGDDLDDILEDLELNSPVFRNEVDTRVARYPDEYANSVNPRARSAEEVLAEMSEKGRISLSMMETLKNSFTNLQRKMGMRGDELTNSEVRAILSTAHDEVVKGNRSGAFFRGDLENRYMASLPEDTRPPTRITSRLRRQDQILRNKVRSANIEAQIAYLKERGIDPVSAGLPAEYSTKFRYMILDESEPRPKGKPRRVGSINIDNIKGIQDIDYLLTEALSRQYEGFSDPVSRATTIRQARELGLTPKSFLKPGMSEAGLAARMAAGADLLFRQLSRIDNLNSKMLKSGDIGSVRYQIMLTKETAILDAIFARASMNGSEVARALNILNRTRHALDDADSFLKYMAQHGGAIKTPEDAAALHRMMANARTPQHRMRLARASMNKQISKYFFRYYFNMILSSPATHVANIVGTLGNIGMDLSSTSIAATLGQRNRWSATNERIPAREVLYRLYGIGNALLSSKTYANTRAAFTSGRTGNQVSHKFGNNSVYDPEANVRHVIEDWAYDDLNRAGRGSSEQSIREKERAQADRLRRVFGTKRVYSDPRRMHKKEETSSGSDFTNEQIRARVEELTANPPPELARAIREAQGSPITGFVMGVTESPTRTLAATDEFLRNIIEASSVYGLAARQAVNKKLKGQALQDEITSLIANPTAAILRQTDDFTQVLQFMDRPSELANALIGLQTPKAKDGVASTLARGAFKLVVPFVSTPDSLMRTSLRYSPLGAFERVNKKDLSSGSSADADMARSRIILGSLIAGWVALQTAQGNITGLGPASYREGQQAEAVRPPNSIRVGDTWVSLDSLEPIGTNVAAVATLVERAQNGDMSDDDYTGSAQATVYQFLSVLTSLTHLENVRNLVELISTDPNRAANAEDNFVAGLVSSVTTPAVLRQYARGEDPAVRDTTADRTSSGRIQARVESGLPGLSEDLPQRHDVYGRPLSRDPLGPPMLSRQNLRPVESDEVVLELDRLREVNGGLLVGPPRRTRLNIDGELRDLTSREFQDYQETSGTWIRQDTQEEMNSPEWGSMSDDERIALVQEIIEDARRDARIELFGEENADEPEE